MHALMLGQVLTLLEALVTAGTLVRLLPGVDTSMPLHLRGVLEAFFTVGTLQRFLPRRVTSVLHELRGGQEATVTQRAFERLLSAVGILMALQRGRLFVSLSAHVALVGLVWICGCR